MIPVLTFDIETIPDVAGLRRLHELSADLSDAEVAELAFQRGCDEVRHRVGIGAGELRRHLDGRKVDAGQ